MAINNTTFRVYVEKLGASEASDFIGNEGDLFYDPNTAQLRLSDGSTPGGVSVSAFIPSNPGIGTGAVVGTLDQVDVIAVGDNYRVALSDKIALAGTLNVVGVTTIASDGSTAYTGGDLTVGGKVRAVKYSTVSDGTLKKNIKRIDNPRNILAGIEGVMFNWISDDSPDVGVIAQDVEKSLPDAVHEVNGVKSVNYNGVIGLLVEAVKELSLENQLLRQDVASIQGKL